MKNPQNETLSLSSIRDKIIRTFRDNNSVLGECLLTNIRRLYYLAIIAIPLRIINIVFFIFPVYKSGTTFTIWHQGIVLSHFVLLIFMIGFFLITSKLKDRTKANTRMLFLQYLAIIVIMASGIVIVTFDQLITTNITPFILICMIIGAVFLIRPFISFLLYAVTYICYYFAIELTITNQDVLLSNRVNGITAVGIGFFLSVMLWRYNYTNIIQKWQIKLQYEQLQRMAYHDSLTDLPNRRLFDKVVKEEIASIQDLGHESVIIIIDIDDFKNINDTYGHPTGDTILIQFANFLKCNVSESDVVSRLGGEEFIILVRQISLDEGYQFAEKLRRLILDKPFIVGLNQIKITCSFGVALLLDSKSNRSENYYYRADKALYLAKKYGKNRVEKAFS